MYSLLVTTDILQYFDSFPSFLANQLEGLFFKNENSAISSSLNFIELLVEDNSNYLDFSNPDSSKSDSVFYDLPVLQTGKLSTVMRSIIGDNQHYNDLINTFTELLNMEVEQNDLDSFKIANYYFYVVWKLLNKLPPSEIQIPHEIEAKNSSLNTLRWKIVQLQTNLQSDDQTKIVSQLQV